MKIFFLGTGAADWPTVSENNPEIRRLSSVLIDDELLIDPGPCVPEALKTFKCDISKIKYIINTHPHSDHYNADTVKLLEKSGGEFIAFKDGEKKQVGKYTVEAFRGNHSTETVHFFICDGEKTVFYGLDGSWLMPDEFYGLVNKNVDLAILDATLGDSVGDIRIIEHNDLGMVSEIKSMLSKYVKRFAVTHLARQFYPNMNKSEEIAEKYGIEIAYDGYETVV